MENPRGNREEPESRHRPKKAARVPTATPGSTPPPLRRHKRRKVYHSWDRSAPCTESDTTDIGSSSDSERSSTSDSSF
nr:MAG: ORF3 [Torque teno polar bear virus 2]